MKSLPYNTELTAEIDYSIYKDQEFTTNASNEIHYSEQIIVYVDGGVSVKTDIGTVYPFEECRWIKYII